MPNRFPDDVNSTLRHTCIYMYIYISTYIYIYTQLRYLSLSTYIYIYTFLTLIKVWCGVPPVLGEALCDAWMANSKPHNSQCVYGQFQSTQFTMCIWPIPKHTIDDGWPIPKHHRWYYLWMLWRCLLKVCLVIAAAWLRPWCSKTWLFNTTCCKCVGVCFLQALCLTSNLHEWCNSSTPLLSANVWMQPRSNLFPAGESTPSRPKKAKMLLMTLFVNADTSRHSSIARASVWRSLSNQNTLFACLNNIWTDSDTAWALLHRIPA